MPLNSFEIILLSIGLIDVLLLIVILFKRFIIQDIINNDNEIIHGSWHGGTFYAQPIIPLQIETDDIELLKLVKSFNLFVVCFWILTVLLLVGLYLYKSDILT